MEQQIDRAKMVELRLRLAAFGMDTSHMSDEEVVEFVREIGRQITVNFECLVAEIAPVVNRVGEILLEFAAESQKFQPPDK